MFFLLSISIYFFHNGCSKKEDWVEQVLQLDVLPIINFHLPFSQWMQQERGLDRAGVTTGCSSYYHVPFTFFIMVAVRKRIG